MSQTHGFIDLRIGHGARGIGDDSVWPSFTDIMTVIVMIFLMALVVIMVRNFDLDRELLSTITAKEAASLANQDLVERLIQIEHSLDDSKSQRDALQANLNEELARLAALSLEQKLLKADLETVISQRQQLQQANTLLEQQKESARLEISTLVESERALSLQIENLREQFSALKLESNEQISSLTGAKQSLSEKLDTVSAQLAEVKLYLQQSQFELAQSETQLQQARSQKEMLTQEVTELRTLSQNVEQRYSIASEEILALTKLITQRKAENAALQDQAAASVRQFKSLQDEYQSLEAKFRDLIRPARSAAGKRIARIWIEKTDAGVQYKIKQPGQPERKIVEEQQMRQILQTLKEKFGDAFYVSIVIPENSGLSYGQASNLMDEIHRKYDYYFQ